MLQQLGQHGSGGPDSGLEALYSGSLTSLLESLRDSLRPLGSTPSEVIASISKLHDAGTRSSYLNTLGSLTELEGLLRQGETSALESISTAQRNALNLTERTPVPEESEPLARRTPYPIDLSKALVVVKLTKIQYEMECKGKTYEEAIASIEERGELLNGRIAAHKRHMQEWHYSTNSFEVTRSSNGVT